MIARVRVRGIIYHSLREAARGYCSTDACVRYGDSLIETRQHKSPEASLFCTRTRTRHCVRRRAIDDVAGYSSQMAELLPLRWDGVKLVHSIILKKVTMLSARAR